MSPNTSSTNLVLTAQFNPTGTSAIIVVSTAQYTDQLHNFNIYNQIEQTIVQNINTALDLDVLTDLIENQIG